ncbi:hypothetical protein K9W22_003318 [Salmonella enterica subsp. enterica serovar Durham]|nr:hypothetical protein [Salmonella enterica subsp. enterica serovar Durham]EIB9803769.1 hypothetical protein [Salmonella enterica subsp. enterica serovar Durham]
MQSVLEGVESGRSVEQVFVAVQSDTDIETHVDAVTIDKFAALIGKTPAAVRIMVDRDKLPYVTMQNPNNPTPKQAERFILISEYNRAMREAYNNRPKEKRDSWLLWLGM